MSESFYSIQHKCLLKINRCGHLCIGEFKTDDPSYSENRNVTICYIQSGIALSCLSIRSTTVSESYLIIFPILVPSADQTFSNVKLTLSRKSSLMKNQSSAQSNTHKQTVSSCCKDRLQMSR